MKEAGCITAHGYRTIVIKGKAYLVHRLIWFLHNETFPIKSLDHIDRNKLNNKITNLREASRSLNSRNINIRSHSRTKVTGVCYCIVRRKFVAYINIEGKFVKLGRFKNKKDAVRARKEAEIVMDYYNRE
jgi:alkyl hydroperoxide reductase subunit AhpF